MSGQKQETNSDCSFYNWGGDGTRERPNYPREYGARCECYDKFFERDSDGILIPNCPTCKRAEVKR
jgi:hypothetical protein